jgi:hypothetical protein
VIKHLGTVVEKDGKEELKPSQLKFDSMDKIYPVGKLALFWKVAEEFDVSKSISKVIGKDDKGTSMALLILVFNQLGPVTTLLSPDSTYHLLKQQGGSADSNFSLTLHLFTNLYGLC